MNVDLAIAGFASLVAGWHWPLAFLTLSQGYFLGDCLEFYFPPLSCLLLRLRFAQRIFLFFFFFFLLREKGEEKHGGPYFRSWSVG